MRTEERATLQLPVRRKSVPVPILAVLLAVGILLAAFVSGCGQASQVPAPDQQGVPAALANEADSSSDAGPVEGIKVHGHWTIEVREADGTIVERREFENAYTNMSRTLQRILSREKTLGGWAIALRGDANGACLTVSGERVACYITEPINPIIYSYTFTTLTVARDDWKLVLRGSAIAQIDGQIGEVSTLAGLCDGADITPQACASTSGASYWFTTKDLAAPITVLEGQQVLATVEISFS